VGLPAYFTKSYGDRPLFAVPFGRGEVHFGPAQFYPETGMVGTSVGVPIQSEGGERVGVLIARLNLQGTIERVKNYPLEVLGEDSQVCLNDNEGKVVAHSGMDLFALAEGPLSLDHSELPMVKAIVAGEPGGFQLYEHEGISYFGSYAVLESNGWGAVVRTPMRAIVVEANTLARRVLLVNLAVFAVALVVMVVLTHQITAERKRAERALRESEELYRTLVETSPDAISLSDLETTILVSNQRTATLLGFETVEEIIGKRSADFIAPEDRQRAMDNARRTLEEGIVRGVEYTFVRKDGTRFPGELSAALIVDAQGKPKAFMALIRDITERKRAEKELARTVSNLQRFNRLAVGRELQMIELKREVNDLLRSMDRQEKYRTPTSENVENETGGQNGRER
jgi:PAS domain S-box-containing protein